MNMMTRHASLLFIGLLCFLASLPLGAASRPVITGTISGVEVCPQSICDQAIFTGNYAGTINGKPASGVFLVGVTHEDLPDTAGGTSAITGGSWMIRTKNRIFTGRIQGGTLTNNGDNTFTVSLTMEIERGGTGTLTFKGLLDHNDFPPTIVGTLSQ
jgi:hypothetical protein